MGRCKYMLLSKKQSSLMELKNDSKASATDIQKQTIIQVLLDSCWSRSIDSFIDLLLQLWMFSSIHQQVWRCCLSPDSRFKAYNSIRVLVLMICSSKKAIKGSDLGSGSRETHSRCELSVYCFGCAIWLQQATVPLKKAIAVIFSRKRQDRQMALSLWTAFKGTGLTEEIDVIRYFKGWKIGGNTENTSLEVCVD